MDDPRGHSHRNCECRVMIREATTQDIPALVALGGRMRAESPRYAKLKFSPEKLTHTLAGVESSEHGFMWIAEVDGELAGVMVALIFEHWMSTDLVASDLALYVEPAHRGSKIAAELVERYKQWAVFHGAVLPQVGVSTGVYTEQTARLYESLGFKRCGVLLEI